MVSVFVGLAGGVTIVSVFVGLAGGVIIVSVLAGTLVSEGGKAVSVGWTVGTLVVTAGGVTISVDAGTKSLVRVSTIPASLVDGAGVGAVLGPVMPSV